MAFSPLTVMPAGTLSVVPAGGAKLVPVKVTGTLVYCAPLLGLIDVTVGTGEFTWKAPASHGVVPFGVVMVKTQSQLTPPVVNVAVISVGLTTVTPVAGNPPP